MGSFADSIKANVKEVKQDINKQILYQASEMFKDVTIGTPSAWQSSKYATGLLINQWYTAQNSLSSEETDSKDLHGVASLNRANNILTWKTFLGKDGYVSFTNNVSYAYQAEVQGWNQTAPYRMVELALIDAENRTR